jgi:hypothetical protein
MARGSALGAVRQRRSGQQARTQIGGDAAPGPSPAPITHREREQLEMRCRALNTWVISTRVIFATYRLGPWG